MSLAQIQEAPGKGVILMVGPPGAGKSAFCRQMALNSCGSACKFTSAGNSVVALMNESCSKEVFEWEERDWNAMPTVGGRSHIRFSGRVTEQEVGNRAAACSG